MVLTVYWIEDIEPEEREAVALRWRKVHEKIFFVLNNAPKEVREYWGRQ